jgi:Clp amino terminal domain, pathogenicity island component
MFNRYTETARRTIFFARYEASQFGSSTIETEHLLLGVLREDKALANRLLASNANIEDLRNSITRRGNAGPKVSTSVDLPLSHELKRALAYGAEEGERLNQKHIGPEHLLLGLLREEKCFAAQLLREKGLTVELVREHLKQSGHPLAQGTSVSIAGLNQWVAERETDGRWTIEQRSVANNTTGNRTTCFAIYPHDAPKENGRDQDLAPAEKLAQTQKHIELVVKRMELAIANHDFEKARAYSDEERKEREHLRRLCEEFNLEAPRPQAPLVCIEVIGAELFLELRQRCEGYIAEGVAEVWLLDPGLKRAYTITRANGLREFKGAILQIANPPLEMDLGNMFG